MPATRALALGPQQATLEKRADGTMLVCSPMEMPEHKRCITDYLVESASRTPDTIFVARRGANGRWIEVTYAQAFARIERLAAGLLTHKLGPERPVAILSGNSIEHLMLALACMHVGIPFAPISTPYSLVSRDYDKLKHVIGLLTPGLIFADDGAAYAGAIRATAPANCTIVTKDGRGGPEAVPLAALEADNAPAVAAANARVMPDTIAKFLFTSGSTGMPKGVINTQRMLCANILQIQGAIPEMAKPQVLVDWLPWNHTFGGNHNTDIVLASGGTLYIDDGRPAPGGFDATIANLHEIAPTCYFSVPKGFEMLVPRLEADAGLAQHFFSRLKCIMYAGASLPQHVWDGFDRIAEKTIGQTIRVVTGLGATETSPSAMFVTQGDLRSGMIGVPVAGCDLKLVPNGDKLEARFRGPNITPGYWRQAEATKNAFDEEGFYKIGDAIRFVDEAEVNKGFWFDGRVSEDFKLTTGTWVSVGVLRGKLVSAFAPLVRDAVIAGHDRESLSAIVLLDHEGCAALTGIAASEAPQTHAAHPVLRDKLAAHLAAFVKTATGSSTRVERIVVLDEHPSLDKGEITDKGSINQRAMLAARKHLVEELYGERPSDRIIAVSR